ncbi:hypothetical protein [Streptomyces ipomoeae]|uniref:hypothetical protein n=1 Tax=Streptomyces ipomoeae TaxID=103232 RepID=UPI0029AEFCAD|nr:hypothetical protein [Streptomyces ipomoeae]MDX2697577.1 hypothetical protein [Streptomyces ipomoeae]
MTQPSIEEQVARYMAAKDWLEDATDDEWWNSRLPKFREDYLTSARKVIGIVNGTAPPVQCPAPEEQP